MRASAVVYIRRHARLLAMFSAGTLLSAAFAVATPLLNGNPDPEDVTRPERGRFPFEISPDPIELGVVRKGEKAQGAFSLFNPGSELLTIERIETSCPCLTVGPAPIRLRPGERTVLAASFDSSGDPDFAGRLSVDITAYIRAKVAFRTLAKIEITLANPKCGAESRPPVKGTIRDLKQSRIARSFWRLPD